EVTEKMEPVYFDNNKSIFSDQEKVKIDRRVNLLKENENYKVKISGHADSVGSDSYNLNLSKKRVNVVVKSIVSSKINSKRIIQQEGFGEAKPAASNDTPEGRALNRRVEFDVIEAK